MVAAAAMLNISLGVRVFLHQPWEQQQPATLSAAQAMNRCALLKQLQRAHPVCGPPSVAAARRPAHCFSVQGEF